MPKAHADDAELYAQDVNSQSDAIQSIVGEKKWIVDLIAIMGLNAGVIAILMTLIAKSVETGLTLRNAAGIVTAAVFVAILFKPCLTLTTLGAETMLKSIRAKLKIPYDLEERHIVFKALWRSIINCIYIVAIWGTALMLAELVKSGQGGG